MKKKYCKCGRWVTEEIAIEKKKCICGRRWFPPKPKPKPKKICRYCGETRQTKFNLNRQGRQCKKCYSKYMSKYWKENYETKRDYVFKWKYGISLNEYNKLLAKQNGRCAICGAKHSDEKRKSHLAIDHEHRKRKKIRGLLCSNCNLGLGNFKDNKELLHKAILYLQNYEATLPVLQNTSQP